MRKRSCRTPNRHLITLRSIVSFYIQRIFIQNDDNKMHSNIIDKFHLFYFFLLEDPVNETICLFIYTFRLNVATVFIDLKEKCDNLNIFRKLIGVELKLNE